MSCNLLTDRVYSVLKNGSVPEIVSLKDILCSDAHYSTRMGYPDLEFAQNQMLASLVQVCLQPENFKELKERYDHLMSHREFDAAIKASVDKFEVVQSPHPFMQRSDAAAVAASARKADKDGSEKELSLPQEIFAFLPKGNNKPLFNRPNEISTACPSCVAISMFFRAMHGPSMGGGFGSFVRGTCDKTNNFHQRSSFSALLSDPDNDLRRMIWLNVLHADFTRGIYPEGGEPTWIQPWTPKESYDISKCSLIRGMFWQPWPVLMKWETGDFSCDVCGCKTDTRVLGWHNSKPHCILRGFFSHPHSIVREPVSNTILIEHKRLSEDTPVWNDFLWSIIEEDNAGTPGKVYGLPALRDAAGNRNLRSKHIGIIVGGYILNSDSSAVERKCFESIDIHDGYLGNKAILGDVVKAVTGVDNALRMAFYKVDSHDDGSRSKALKVGLDAMKDGRRAYYRHVEQMVLDSLSQDPSQFESTRKDFVLKLRNIAWKVFEENVRHLEHRFTKQVAFGKNCLKNEIAALIKMGGYNE